MLDNIKKVMLYVVWPLLILLGGIAYLVQKIASLKQQLGQVTYEKDMATILERKAEVTKDADQKGADYESLRDKYSKSNGSGSSNLPGNP